MKPIQLLLIAACVSLVLFYFRQLRSRVIDRVVVLGLGAMAVALLCAPAVSTKLAHLTGVGRGADLVIYLAFAGLGFVTLLFYSQQRKLEARVTELTRTLALLDARQPPGADPDRTITSASNIVTQARSASEENPSLALRACV